MDGYPLGLGLVAEDKPEFSCRKNLHVYGCGGCMLNSSAHNNIFRCKDKVFWCIVLNMVVRIWSDIMQLSFLSVHRMMTSISIKPRSEYQAAIG